MCCLFGMMDVNGHFSKKQKSQVIHALATAAEARGTDATGIAYNTGGKLHVHKRPIPGHLLRFHVPEDVKAVMGHTRLTTQGDQQRNYNNHPFQSQAGGMPFALAHNGMLHNDRQLRKSEKLPRTKIETDSFVAVQLLERQGQVSFDSLKYMAEQLEGSFTFTVLDGADSLYFVKGDNPMCIYHFPRIGVYLYASTEEILLDALLQLPYHLGRAEKIKISCGELLLINTARASGVGKNSTQMFCSRFTHVPLGMFLCSALMTQMKKTPSPSTWRI